MIGRELIIIRDKVSHSVSLIYWNPNKIEKVIHSSEEAKMLMVLIIVKETIYFAMHLEVEILLNEYANI